MTLDRANKHPCDGRSRIHRQPCLQGLAAAGYRPVAYDFLVRGNSASVNWGPLEQGDVRDTERLRTVIRQYRPAAVIHFAAFAYVGESMDLPLMCHDNNVGGTISLLKAMNAEGMDRLVFSSSCATYGIPASVPITESTPQKPINPYGRSKLMAEEIIGDACSGLRMSAVMLRYFNAAGADLDGEIGECHDPETHIVPLILRAAIRRSEQLTVFGTDYPTHDGTCIRDYVHVSDLADAHVRSVQYLEANKGLLALNLGSGNGVSIGQLITAAERVTGLPVPHRFAPRRQGDPRFSWPTPRSPARHWDGNRADPISVAFWRARGIGCRHVKTCFWPRAALDCALHHRKTSRKKGARQAAVTSAHGRCWL